jgi:GWxTD domain-containing protein
MGRARSNPMDLLRFCLFCAAAVAASSQSSPAAGAGQIDSAKPAKPRQELPAAWKSWLNEDVACIITDEERTAFRNLATDEERQSFIEQFWIRRDPTPDTVENEFEDEHYRRIAYVNEHFAGNIPGWKTDRGRIYIEYGPPDEIESHAAGGGRPYSYEDWRYRFIEGIGKNVVVEFVDPTLSGEYHMTAEPKAKDADSTPLPNQNRNEAARLEVFAGAARLAAVKDKELKDLIASPINYNTLPIQVRADYIPVTGYSVLTPITISIRKADLQFNAKDGYARATVSIHGQIATMPRRVLTTFEDVINVETSSELLALTMKGTAMYQKIVPLPAGTYRLNVAARDMVAGTVTTYEMAINVPRREDEKLSSSSLILADAIEKVPTRRTGPGQFVIGDTKVRPRLNETFSQSEKLGIYTQLYNFASDGRTGRPNGSIEYEVVKIGTNEKAFDYTEEVGALPGASVHQVTVEKILPLDKLSPGQYTLRLKVTDRTRKSALTPAASFTVTAAESLPGGRISSANPRPRAPSAPYYIPQLISTTPPRKNSIMAAIRRLTPDPAS